MRISNILFTGLVRNENLFINKLEKALELRKSGLIKKVVFSTWIGEASKYPIVYDYIKKNDIVLIESTEPNVKSPGYILHQMKTLYHGLSFFNNNEFVYKMRPDLGPFNIENVKEVITNINLDIEDKIKDKVLINKIVVDGGFIMHPFYINDIQFYGLNEDLKKLINFDLKYEVIYNDISPEQYFYISPFIDYFPKLKMFFSINQGLMHGNEDLARKYFYYFLESNHHLEALSNYIYILDKYFYINGVKKEKYNESTTLLDIFSGNVNDVFIYPALPYAPAFKGDNWICFIKHYKGEDLGIKKIQDFLINVSPYKSNNSNNIFSVDNEIFDVVQKLDICFNNRRGKLAKKISDYHYRFLGGAIRLNSTSPDSQLVTHLENQLNDAKRKYDIACQKLEEEINKNKKLINN